MLRTGFSLRRRSIFSTCALLGLSMQFSAALAIASKPVVRDMYEVFSVGSRPSRTPAVSGTTIKHQVFFTDLEGSTSGWGTVDFRQGQPNAWNRVSGVHSCVGQAWWCGQTVLAHGDGYDNNWVQTLKTNTPINLAGSSGNVLTFKHRFQAEYGFDWGWVMVHDAAAGSAWDTLVSYSGNFGSSCGNASVDIPNSWTTRAQPIQLLFLFGSDLTVSASDSTDLFTGWSVDDVKVTASGNIVKFFDDMEGGSANWVASSPDPGPLWHVENSPGTSLPATCFFLSTNVWVPFQGFEFGLVPDFADAMLTSPPMDLQGVFVGTASALRLQFDDWINLPSANAVYWSLYIQGSADGVTNWTPWKNALNPLVFSGGTAQCVEGSFIDFNPYLTVRTGLQPGTRYIRLGFRLRDQKQTSEDGEVLRLGIGTEGIYFDNVGVYSVYTISGVEGVSEVPAGARASVQRVYPNPFNPRTTVEFSVPRPGWASVRVYDLQGKAVATLAQEEMAAGVYRVRWDGRAEDGRELSSGVYFVSVESGRSRASARLTMIK